jgi:ATP-binding cassette, subfamily F, member 3
MIHAQNLRLFFGNQAVFDDISFTLAPDQRVGLVGANGSGKSTLLKVIARQQSPDSGTVSIVGSATIAYMPQDVVLESSKTVYEEALSAFERMYALQHEALHLEQIIETTKDHHAISRYAEVHEELEHIDTRSALSETKQVLTGLGFSAEQQQSPVAHLSVGWKMRLVLAKLLLKKADFYLFDEPTNHLDLIAKDWFLKFLKESSFGFLLVCHDRYFLDQLCDEIIALEFGKAKRYRGNYSFYEAQHEQELEALYNAYEQQQREIKQKEKTIERFRAKASKAKMAKSMEKNLERIERITLPPSPKNVAFSFPDVQRSGRIVVSVHNVGHSFGNKSIFQNASFEIEREQKVALVAPNGTGKSTLFSIITGQQTLQTGTIELGHNVQPALFAQDQNKSLNGNATILENVQSCCPQKSDQIVRGFLGAFLFSGEDVYKKVKVLSGGEKNRVSMACVLLQDANFLMLDEPTNHLDIRSKDVLLKALQVYNGTILFVSHDRDFVNRLATHIIELTADGTRTYAGNYDAYLYQKGLAVNTSPTHQTQQTVLPSEKVSSQVKTNDLEHKKTIKRIESKVDRIEKEISQHEFKFAELIYGTPAFDKNQETLKRLKQELDELLEEWEKIVPKN